MDKADFAHIINSKWARNKFARRVVSAAKRYGWQGVQFRCHHVLSAESKGNFTAFLAELSNLFPKKPDECPFAISLRIPAWELNIEHFYDVPSLNRLDSIVLEPFQQRYRNAEVVSPMFTMDHNDKQWAVDKTMKRWIRSGVQPSALILQIPSYGVSYSKNASGTWVTTFMSRTPMCPILGKFKAQPKLFYDAVTAYFMTPDGSFITYEGELTVDYRVRYAQREGLGGVGIFTLNSDDHDGEACGRGVYPILHAPTSFVVENSSEVVTGFVCSRSVQRCATQVEIDIEYLKFWKIPDGGWREIEQVDELSVIPCT
ncbi:hypothetical protein QR680_007259 [Steinernema hermaphroditum]|uniref:GH18 domain-containing protein n=1 Tax=Steinernema hermaphroditum TaxID=289476 RepID=A0AA39LYU3_9BILA|nr:hypothetical protein QR680_007259 [Steinernema hermaphroditum]